MGARLETLPARRYTGPHGLTLIVRQNHASPLTAVALYCLGGVRMERPAIQGLTYFVQRLLPKGTTSRSAAEVAEELEYLGASFSPFTAKDVAGASMTILSRNFVRGLELFADCLLRPAFVPEEVEKERRSILAEIRRRHDDNMSYAMELAEGALFRRHPYRFPVTGAESSVGRLTAQEIATWHGRLYSPERTVISVVGDLRTAEMHDRVFEAFAGFRSSGWQPEAPPAEEPPPRPRVRRRRRQKRQVALAVAFQAPAFGTEEYYAFDVLSHVLSGMGGRLFMELRERQGLCYSVSSHLEARLDTGLFVAHVATSPERRRQALEALLGELYRVAHEPVPREEISRAKKYMLGLYEIALQRKAVQASRSAFYEVMGAGHQALEEYPKNIRAVNAERIQQAARRYLLRGRYGCGQVLPLE
jgi:zinc protease